MLPNFLIFQQNILKINNVLCFRLYFISNSVIELDGYQYMDRNGKTFVVVQKGCKFITIETHLMYMFGRLHNNKYYKSTKIKQIKTRQV